jgi:DNA topoisomerase I
MDPLGHLQATGVDAAERKQYLYHERWRAHRDRRKFDSMLAFGAALPALRRTVARELDNVEGQPKADELSAPLVLACAVRLLDLGFFRIGSEDYAEQNESYGLSTMLREHVSLADEELIFDFPAKSGQRRVQAIADEQALAVVAALKRRRIGERLLAYRERGAWHELSAEEVNAYLKEHCGESFTAKDFRTWNATVLAAVALAAAEDAAAGAARERQVKKAVQTVAAYLGNTPAVCRASYVDPRVIDRYQGGVTIAQALDARKGVDLARPRVRARVERAVLELLKDAAD